MAIVADANPLLARLQTLLQQCVVIAVVAISRDLQRHRRTEVGNAPATRIEKVRHGVVGSHVVIDDDARGIHARADSVVEHERHAAVDQALEMVVLLRVFRLRDNDSADLMLVERLANAHFAVVLLVALGHENAVAVGRRLLLDAAENRRKIEMRELRNDDSDDFLGSHTRMSERFGQKIRREMMLAGVCLDALALLQADLFRVLQRTGNRRHGNSQFPRNVPHRDRCSFVHFVFLVIRRSSPACKIRQNDRYRFPGGVLLPAKLGKTTDTAFRPVQIIG